MKQTIFLRCDQRGVQGMTKNMPDLYKDEIVVKLNVEIDNKAFGAPSIEQSIYIEDWGGDVDIQDVNIDKPTLTKQEAEMIRAGRIERMKEVLEAQGFSVTRAEASE